MLETYLNTRQATLHICEALIIEDYSVQPSDFASPPKWHLGHTTWFWEQFVLIPYKSGYKVYSEDFAFLFNSYYNALGDRVLRKDRGLMTRPGVEQVLAYRRYVDSEMGEFLKSEPCSEILAIIETGINHEQQHQELLVYDIKYLLGTQPLQPPYHEGFITGAESRERFFHKVEGGLYRIGHKGTGFCFDVELPEHKVYVDSFEIANTLVTNAEYLEFIEAGGYHNFSYWHDEGWHWVKDNAIEAPLYWAKKNGSWLRYDLDGVKPLDPDAPVMHISYYEAYAFCQWKGMRLPTEQEWEIASGLFNWGKLWEWTGSAFLPYPGFASAEGALGEYNGKFMIRQMVLRGGSVATPKGHSRHTYRNFFHPSMRWMYAGLRLATLYREEH